MARPVARLHIWLWPRLLRRLWSERNTQLVYFEPSGCPKWLTTISEGMDGWSFLVLEPGSLGLAFVSFGPMYFAMARRTERSRM